MKDMDGNLNRRTVLKTTGLAGLTAVAGCMGGSGGSGGDGGNGGGNGGNGGNGGSGGDGNGGGNGGNGLTTLNMGGGGSGSSTNTAGQALSRALSEHSDTVRMNIQETEGWVSNTYLYNSGELTAASLDNNTAAKAFDSQPPFEENPVDSIPHQGFVHSSLHIYFVAVEGSGIESTDDLVGKRVYPIQPGFGTRLLTEEVIREAGLWEQIEVLNLDTSDIAGAVEEGRVDALAVYGSNFVSLSGWVSEVDARANVYAIDVADDFRQTIEEIPGARVEQFEPYGWNQDVTSQTDEVVAWTLDGQWRFGPEVSSDVAYEIARVSHEHNDTVREADPNYTDHTEPENMAAAVMDGQPVHPGVADYFKELDVWNDSWQVGDVNE